MTEELAALLQKVRAVDITPEQLREHRIALAVANGSVSDSRVTEDAMRATIVVVEAAQKTRDDGC